MGQSHCKALYDKSSRPSRPKGSLRKLFRNIPGQVLKHIEKRKGVNFAS
jgi:hypothetical protein